MVIKSLDEFNREFMLRRDETARKRSPVAGALTILATVLIAISLLASSKYTFFAVMTSSMHDELPKGSLILTRQTDPSALKEGDNITFVRDWNTTVTHKIFEILENHRETGERGFRTKGTNNLRPDEEIVTEDRIVGKVVFSVPGIGTAITYMGDNMHILYIVFGACVVLAVMTAVIRSKMAESKNSGDRSSPRDGAARMGGDEAGGEPAA